MDYKLIITNNNNNNIQQILSSNGFAICLYHSVNKKFLVNFEIEKNYQIFRNLLHGYFIVHNID